MATAFGLDHGQKEDVLHQLCGSVLDGFSTLFTLSLCSSVQSNKVLRTYTRGGHVLDQFNVTKLSIDRRNNTVEAYHQLGSICACSS